MNLKPGPVWNCFEAFRVGHAANLISIKAGEVATLTSKGQSWRMLSDADYQALTARARLAHDLQEAAEDVRLALDAHLSSQSEVTRQLLNRCVARLSGLRDQIGNPA